MDIEFKSARELYMKVIPALNTKKRILNKKGIKISDKEIFEFINNYYHKLQFSPEVDANVKPEIENPKIKLK